MRKQELALDLLDVPVQADPGLERGGDRRMRIALAGYAGEGHELLEQHGWSVFAWSAAGGYGNRSAKGKANAKKERIWFSPHCLTGAEPCLFGDD